MTDALRAGLCACLLFSTASVRAFEGWEHEAAGTMSLIVAGNYVAQHHAGQADYAERLKKLRETTEEFRHGLRSEDGETDVTFGRIVKLVDFMRDPYDMTHQSSTGDGWPTSGENCNVPFLQRLLKDKVSYLSSSHANHNHFQGRAMFSFWFWHRQAVHEAQEGNLWGGLLLEAYANHFLEDLFAPGHILAPRDENAHDVYTLALHDYYNKRGLTYVVGEPGSLKPIVESMAALVRKETLTTPPLADDVTEEHQLHLTPEAVRSLSQALAGGPAEFLCHGDNLIRENAVQLPLVVGYCARAVADVMESYLQGAGVNSFNRYRWQVKFFPMKFGRPDIEAIDVRLDFGKLSCLDKPKTVDTDDLRPWALLRPDNPDQQRDTFPVTENIHFDGFHNPIVALNAGMQTVMLDADTHVRGLWELETMVYGKRFDFMRPDWDVPDWLPGQLAVNVGYSGVAGGGDMGHGAYVRGIIPLPKLNMDFSLMAGLRYHWDDEDSGWGDFEKIRAEWGLHMVSLFVGLGHERFGTEDGFAVDVGFTLGGPVSSFRRLVPKF